MWNTFKIKKILKSINEYAISDINRPLGIIKLIPNDFYRLDVEIKESPYRL
jgi:hypothetical protein